MATEDMNNTDSQLSPLRYHEKLDKLSDTVNEYFSERTADVYRTVMTVPPTDADLIPQRYRHKSDSEVNEMLITYSEEDIAEMSDEDKRDEVSGDAISVNTSPEKCKTSAQRTYRTVKRKFPQPVPDEFKANRGSYIVKFSIRPEHGMLSKPKNGNMNLLLRKGVGINDIWNPSFTPVKFEYDDESGEDNN